VSQVNLLPPEIFQRQRIRRLTALVALAGGAILGLALLFYLLQVGTLGGVRDDIAAQRRTNDGIRADIAELQQFADLQAEAETKLGLLRSAFAGETSFSGVLMDVSRVIPATAYLTQFDAQLSTGAAEGADAAEAIFVGTLSASGVATDLDAVADWITRLESVDGWENAWLQSASEGETGTFTFSSGVDLSPEVVTDRGRGEVA
jgi:Tfp pilus assembly protein PilN